LIPESTLNLPGLVAASPSGKIKKPEFSIKKQVRIGGNNLK